MEVVEAQKPRLLAFNGYSDDEGEVAVVQVHPDPDSMLFHIGVVRDHIERAYEVMEETRSIEVYGTPTDEVLAMIRQLAATGSPVRVKGRYVGGFTRLRAG